MTDQASQNQGTTTNQDQSMSEIVLDLPINENTNEPEISISLDDIQNVDLDLSENQLENQEIQKDFQEKKDLEDSDNSNVLENNKNLNPENIALDEEDSIDINNFSIENNVVNNHKNDDINRKQENENNIEIENNNEKIKSDFGSLNESISQPELTNSTDIVNEESVENLEENAVDSIANSQEVEDGVNSEDFEIKENSDKLVSDIEERSDDWLAKEDALLAEKERENLVVNNQVIESKQEPIMEDDLNVLNVISEANKEAIEEALNVGGTVEQINQNFPENSSWESDQEIINQLKTTEEPSIPVQNDVLPSSTEMNLDDLLGGDSSFPVVENLVDSNNAPNSATMPQIDMYNVVQNPINQSTIPVQNNPVPNTEVGMQGFAMPTVVQNVSEKIKDPKKRNIFFGIGIGALAILIGVFMLKTMYPLEYKQIADAGASTNDLENELADNSLEFEIENESDSTTSDLFNNPALDNYHGSSLDFEGISDEEFNAFEDIETEMEPDFKLIEKLENFIEVGRKYTVLGKKNKDDVIVKYSLFLYRKASALLTDVENGKQITTDELNDQIADLENYLQKLTGKNSDGEIVLPQTNIPSPEEFFGTTNFGGGEESESKEESSGIGGFGNEETKETSDEDISGDESSDLQFAELDR